MNDTGCTTCGSIRQGCSSTKNGLLDRCNKLTVFDWLSDLHIEGNNSLWIEVRFKNVRKDFFYNIHRLSLHVGDYVVVEAQPGRDLGMVTAKGYMAEILMQKKGVLYQPETAKKVIRVARQEDLDLWNQAKARETETLLEARRIAREMKLDMKISDVEFQADNTKAIFYYIADQRVDFRELIKVYAKNFKIRVEMKQIGTRQEAALVGGIGSCGRELCCSTWLTDFRSVSTTAVRYQQLALNPEKLTGQCGKLKCCLNYELDHYVDALKLFPDMEKRTLKFSDKELVWFKNDIFKQRMWFYEKKETNLQFAIHLEKVKEIIAQNEKGIFPSEIPTAVYASGQADLDQETDLKDNEVVQVLEDESKEALERRVQKLKKNQKKNNKKFFNNKKK